MAVAALAACSKDEPVDPDAGKAKIENVSVSPTDNLKYGDPITIAADLSDEAGLRSYTIKISYAGGDLFEQTQMLTGRTFSLNQQLLIPLPPNATAGDVTVSLSVRNSGNQLSSIDTRLPNVAVPVFTTLYIVINNTVYSMTKDGSVFEFEDFIPAGATGKIHASQDRQGLYWGREGDAIKTLAADDIVFGKDEEAFFKIIFDPLSFSLTSGNAEQWQPMTSNELYILGTISGHWADGEIISERSKMKMTGYQSGNLKRWDWTPPNSGTGDAEDDMWGNIVAGKFRFKKAGQEQYILFNGTNIITAADNKDQSFVVTAGGPISIRVMTNEAGDIISVRLYDAEKSLEYQNGRILINGIDRPASVAFADTPLNLKAGQYFIYEGTLNLTKDQTVAATGINLATAFADPDVFTGSGNASWKHIQETGAYYITIDAFSGHIYIRENTGYPKAIYLDGWSWKKYPADPRADWDPNTALTLYKKAGTDNVFEAIFYIYPWGGDVNLFAYPPSTAEGSVTAFFAEDFDDPSIVVGGGPPNMKIPSVEGYHKISVNLKNGFDVNKDVLRYGSFYTVTPKNNQKFSVTFTAQ
jgi:hypothetical protein